MGNKNAMESEYGKMKNMFSLKDKIKLAKLNNKRKYMESLYGKASKYYSKGGIVITGRD